jgi:hypothetical protein
MTKILTLSDIHNKVLTAQRVIDEVSHDKCILLGDYFDSYGDTPTDARKTAIWLKECVLHNPKIVPLMGNHCTSYIYKDNINFRCSGYTTSKNIEINKILTEEDKSRFKVYHIEQNFLFSHAGLTKPIWQVWADAMDADREYSLEFVDEVLSEAVAEDIERAKNGENAMLFGAGWDRGGIQMHGGINWVDWNSFSPVKNINQIVGHTRHRVPHILVQQKGGGIYQGPITEYYKRKFKDPLSVNYALDTDSNHYMVIEDGVVEIYDSMHHVNLRDVGTISINESEMNNLT